MGFSSLRRAPDKVVVDLFHQKTHRTYFVKGRDISKGKVKSNQVVCKWFVDDIWFSVIPVFLLILRGSN